MLINSIASYIDIHVHTIILNKTPRVQKRRGQSEAAVI